MNAFSEFGLDRLEGTRVIPAECAEVGGDSARDSGSFTAIQKTDVLRGAPASLRGNQGGILPPKADIHVALQ